MASKTVPALLQGHTFYSHEDWDSLYLDRALFFSLTKQQPDNVFSFFFFFFFLAGGGGGDECSGQKPAKIYSQIFTGIRSENNASLARAFFRSFFCFVFWLLLFPNLLFLVLSYQKKNLFLDFLWNFGLFFSAFTLRMQSVATKFVSYI